MPAQYTLKKRKHSQNKTLDTPTHIKYNKHKHTHTRYNRDKH